MKRLQLLSLLLTLLATPSMGQIFLPSDPVGSQAIYRITKEGKVSADTTTLCRTKGNRLWTEGEVPYVYSRSEVSTSLDDIEEGMKGDIDGVPRGAVKVKVSSNSGDVQRELPLNGVPGLTFPDQTIHTEARILAVIRMDMDITTAEDRILRMEEMETPFGTREVMIRHSSGGLR